MGTEAAPHLPGSASCILMIMQFLQLCPWKRHTGVQRVPPAGAKEPPDDMATATSLWALMQEKGLVTEGCLSLVQSRAFPPWGAGSSRSGAGAAVGGNRKQGWEAEVCPACRAEHRLAARSPVLCIANCFCRQAGCL